MNELDRAVRIRRLFDEVVNLDPRDRAFRLAEACGTDASPDGRPVLLSKAGIMAPAPRWRAGR